MAHAAFKAVRSAGPVAGLSLRALGVLLAQIFLGQVAGSSVEAQQGDRPSALLLMDQRVAPAVQAQVASVLAEMVSPEPDDFYLGIAAQDGLDPGAPETMAAILPNLQLVLGIVVQNAGTGSLQLRYHDGESGEIVAIETLWVTPTGMSPPQAQRLREITARQLGVDAPMPGNDAGSAGGLPPAGDYPPEEGLPAAEGLPPMDEEAPGAESLEGWLSLGFGVGGRKLTWPANGGEESLDAGNFAAFALSCELDLAAGEHFWIAPTVTYESSLGHSIEEQHVDAATREMALRVHRLDVGLGALVGFGETGELRFAVVGGYGLRGLRPEVHQLRTPTATLSGPYLRPELRFPLGGALSARVGLEGQWIAQVGSELQALGADPGGVAAAGELRIDYALSPRFHVGIRGRYGMLWVSGPAGQSFVDTERFTTAHLGASL